MTSTLPDISDSDDSNPALLISCENLGITSSSNVGVYRALREGLATSASLVAPAPWARAAAADYRGEDIGVSLTLIAECEMLKWGPLTYAPSLLGGDGGFPNSVADVWEHADLEEVRKEWHAQIERAILWGFDISHLSLHLPGIELRPEFFDAYLDLAEEFRLPIRLANKSMEKIAGFHFRELAAERGVIFPDNFISAGILLEDTGIAEVLKECKPGINAIQLDAAIDTHELRSACSNWAEVVSNLALLTSRHLFEPIKNAGIKLIGYRDLRNAMRKNHR